MNNDVLINCNEYNSIARICPETYLTIIIDKISTNINMTTKIVCLLLLVALAMSRSYPLYKQCDSRWGS
jgi:hypothetical protein